MAEPVSFADVREGLATTHYTAAAASTKFDFMQVGLVGVHLQDPGGTLAIDRETGETFTVLELPILEARPVVVVPAQRLIVVLAFR